MDIDLSKLLSFEEYKLLVLLSGGYTNSEIAEILHYSAGTITQGLNKLYRKLGISADIKATGKRKNPRIRAVRIFFMANISAAKRVRSQLAVEQER